MYKILIVDDEPDIIEFLSFNLRAQQWDVRTSTNGLEALEIAKEWIPDLILLDVMMPEIDGITLCGEIRKISSLNRTLVIILTARSEDYSQIAGFDAGADDYIAKPIRPAVLISRLKALLKRHKDSTIVSPPDLQEAIVIDSDRHIAIVEGVEYVLPRKEFALLRFLMSRPGKVFSRDEIYSAVWGDEVIVGDRTIDVHIRKLRERIGDNYIQTLKGVGYKINLD